MTKLIPGKLYCLRSNKKYNWVLYSGIKYNFIEFSTKEMYIGKKLKENDCLLYIAQRKNYMQYAFEFLYEKTLYTHTDTAKIFLQDWELIL